MDFSIDQSLAACAPDMALAVITAEVAIDQGRSLDRLLDQACQELAAGHELAEVAALPPVAATRQVYKCLGKSPSRYRCSSEALLRRVLQGKGLYRVSGLVDINNLVSLTSGHPVGSYDLERLEPPVVLRAGLPGESYQGIGKDAVNLEGLPLLADRSGPFGSPTSDSRRAMISPATTRAAMVIFAFAGAGGLAGCAAGAAQLLAAHCHGREIAVSLVTP